MSGRDRATCEKDGKTINIWSAKPFYLMVRYKGKSYRATVEIVRTSDRVAEFCRKTCIKLECCPNLFGPRMVLDRCSENCSVLTKTKYSRSSCRALDWTTILSPLHSSKHLPTCFFSFKLYACQEEIWVWTKTLSAEILTNNVVQSSISVYMGAGFTASLWRYVRTCSFWHWVLSFSYPCYRLSRRLAPLFSLTPLKD